MAKPSTVAGQAYDTATPFQPLLNETGQTEIILHTLGRGQIQTWTWAFTPRWVS